jgi:hypothetical protein
MPITPRKPTAQHRSTARAHQPAILLIALGLAAAALPTAGCNVIGPIAMVVAGPPKTQAQYTLPVDKTAVIVIDDRASRTPQRSLRDVVGRTAEEELLRRGLVKDMVKSNVALGVLARERFGEPMTIAELGTALKAQTVIYATVDEFSLSPDGQTFSPFSRLRVRVVDAQSGERLFPPPGTTDWAPLNVDIPTQATENPAGGAQSTALQDLARVTGLALAQMFYTHESREAPKRLRERQ